MSTASALPTLPTPPTLPTELSIYTAAETRATWLAWLADEAAALHAATAIAPLDASLVDSVDGAGVQLLLALARTLRERGFALQLAAPSATLRAAFDALGAGALLQAGASA